MATNITYGELEACFDNNSIVNGVRVWNEYSIDSVTSVLARNEHGLSTYAIFIFQFSTSAFSGVPQYLKFTFKGAGSGNTDPANLRFSLCTSMTNRDSYQTSFNPSDSYRIAQTDASLYLSGSLETITIEFETAQINPNMTYYLVGQNMTTVTSEECVSDLWVAYSKGVTIEIGYNSGLVYINNEEYQCFVGNGGTSGTEADWDLCIPCIGNGGTSGTEADWDICS